METADELPTVSMTNTKKEMLAAYQEMKAALEAKDREVLDAEKEKEKYRKEAARAAADRAAAEDPLRLIESLKASITRELTGLAEKYEAETHEYERLKEAVAEKQEELSRIFGVETAAADLAALIEAQRQKRAQFEAETATARAAREREKQEHDERLKVERGALDRQRTWELEEYEYTVKREREQRRLGLEDEMAALEREISAKREAFEKKTAARERELGEREEAVAGRERRVEELEARVQAFPDQLASEVAIAVEEMRDRLKVEYTGREALLSKGFEGEKNVLTSRIEALRDLADRQAKQIDALSVQQEKAYDKVQDIASKAVEGARRSIVAPPSPTGPKAEVAEG